MRTMVNDFYRLLAAHRKSVGVGALLAVASAASLPGQAAFIVDNGTELLMPDFDDVYIDGTRIGETNRTVFSFEIFETDGTGSYGGDIEVTFSGLEEIGSTASTRMFQQRLSIFNNSADSHRVAVANGQDIGMGSAPCDDIGGYICDLANIDDSTRTVFATHQYEPVLFAQAVSVREEAKLAALVGGGDHTDWLFSDLEPDWQPSSHGFNDDYSVGIGADLGFFDPFEVYSVTFYYLWGKDMTSVPADFKSMTGLPEPTSLLLMGIGMLGLILTRRLPVP